MEKVLNQAEQLAEAILDSEIYIKMRIAEQAAMHDTEAVGLIADYNQCRGDVETLLASNDLNHTALADAGAKLESAEKVMDENMLIKVMRETNAAFADMMQQVNKIIKYVVTGEAEQEESCSGSCGSCGGCHH
jgi:cell fate (sporulation/competence/biofilm development) regulator YlbF (YheA/YmcA/DUF963 family)